MKKVPSRGFTLIEILVVIGIIAILAAIVIVAVNPSRQFAQAHNAQRESNVNAILNALGQNLADNKGVISCTGITSSAQNIGTAHLDLTSCLTPNYLPSLPVDPIGGSAADTGYTVLVDANGRYTVAAPSAELGVSISVTR